MSMVYGVASFVLYVGDGDLEYVLVKYFKINYSLFIFLIFGSCYFVTNYLGVGVILHSNLWELY